MMPLEVTRSKWERWDCWYDETQDMTLDLTSKNSKGSDVKKSGNEVCSFQDKGGAKFIDFCQDRPRV